MADNVPAKEFIFHFGSIADVVDDHVMPAGPFFIDDDSDMRHAATQIPGHNVTRQVILRPKTNRQNFSFSREESHQVGNPSVINVAVRMSLRFVRISREISLHVFVNLLLSVDTDGAVNPNHLIGAYAGVRRDIPAWIWDTDVIRNVANGMVSAFDSSSHKFS